MAKKAKSVHWIGLKSYRDFREGGMKPRPSPYFLAAIILIGLLLFSVLIVSRTYAHSQVEPTLSQVCRNEFGHRTECP